MGGAYFGLFSTVIASDETKQTSLIKASTAGRRVNGRLDGLDNPAAVEGGVAFLSQTHRARCCTGSLLRHGSHLRAECVIDSDT